MLDYDGLLDALCELKDRAKTDEQWEALDLMFIYCEANPLEIGEFLTQEYADGR